MSDGANSHLAVEDQSYVGRGATVHGSSGAPTRRPSADTHNPSGGGPNRFRNNPKTSGVPGRTHAEPRSDGSKPVANNNGLSTGKDDGRGDLNASAAPPSGGAQKRSSETESAIRQAPSTANNGSSGKSRPTSPPPPPVENSFSKSSSLVNGQ